MKGYCTECETLVPIEVRKEGKRPATTYPKQHPARGDDTGGRECPGTRVPV